MIQTDKKRLVWLDVARGIAILLVIVGHTTHCVSWLAGLRGFIYSFHMPLFFMLSAATIRFSDTAGAWWRNVGKAFRRLIVPVILIWAFCSACRILTSEMSWSDVGKLLLTLIMAQGWKHTFLGFEIPALGMGWFLIVLFAAKVLFDALHLWCPRWPAITSLALMCLGVVLGRYSIYPLAIDTAFVVIGFLFLGRFLNKLPDRYHLLTSGGGSSVVFRVYSVCEDVSYVS